MAADEFATRLGPALSAADDAIFDWLAAGQPAGGQLAGGQAAIGQPASGEPVGGEQPVRPLRPDDVPVFPPGQPRGEGGRAIRATGAPDSDALVPLTEFLVAHRDEQVVVEWRVQE